MIPPIVSYTAFNRMGLTVRNLKKLLDVTRDDFEMHIIDSGSKDDTWAFLQDLQDSRIKSKTRLPQNAGPIYAVNLNLTKRKPGQYFIVLESDVYIHTGDWISRFLNVFDAFPEAGLLGVAYDGYMPPVVDKHKDGVGYRELKWGRVGAVSDFVPGHCQCLRPELLDILGYWSEESHFGDAEISVRVNNYTPYRAGFVTDIRLELLQSMGCCCCEGQEWCSLDKKGATCFKVYQSRYRNRDFASTYKWKYTKYFEELEQGKRSVYCASMHDPQSVAGHVYNSQWARENFDFYIRNAN